MKEFLELMKESEAQEFAEVGQRAVKIANFDEKLTSFVNLIGNKAAEANIASTADDAAVTAVAVELDE